MIKNSKFNWKNVNKTKESNSLSDQRESKGNPTYYVYILRTSSNTLYIGQTNNLEKRIKEHQGKNSKSAKYIRYFQSFELVYSETYNSRIETMRREHQLKCLTRSKKEALIKSDKKVEVSS